MALAQTCDLACCITSGDSVRLTGNSYWQLPQEIKRPDFRQAAGGMPEELLATPAYLREARVFCASAASVPFRFRAEGLLQFSTRAILVAGSSEGHAQVITEGRVIRRATHRVFSERNRDLVVALLVLNPGQRIVHGVHVGRYLLRLGSEAQSHVEVVTLLGVDPGQVVGRDRIVGVL